MGTRNPAIGPAVLFEKHGGVAIVSLNRPQVLNAYNVAMRDALFETLGAVRDDPDVRVMILRGNGAAFCTGGDLTEFGSAPSAVRARAVRWQRDNWSLLRRLPKITIAAVHGYVVGGGFEMALLCDLCVAASNARFAYPETGLGMIPGVVGTQTTPRLLGVGRALDLLLTGRWLRAREALELGIVTRIVPRRELDGAVRRLAARLAELPAALLSSAKRAIDAGLDLPLQDGLALEKRLARLHRPTDQTKVFKSTVESARFRDSGHHLQTSFK